MQKGSGISFVVPDLNRTKDVLCARVVYVFLDMVYERLRIRATDYVLAAVFEPYIKARVGFVAIVGKISSDVCFVVPPPVAEPAVASENAALGIWRSLQLHG